VLTEANIGLAPSWLRSQKGRGRKDVNDFRATNTAEYFPFSPLLSQAACASGGFEAKIQAG
jgi:hypothetical protein